VRFEDDGSLGVSASGAGPGFVSRDCHLSRGPARSGPFAARETTSRLSAGSCIRV